MFADTGTINKRSMGLVKKTYTFRISSGPSAYAVIPGTRSPSLLAISWLLARYRGPGISPALIASRTTTSNRFFAAAAPKHLNCQFYSEAPNERSGAYIVYPESRKHFALLAVNSVCSSIPSSPKRPRSPPFQLRCVCASPVQG